MKFAIIENGIVKNIIQASEEFIQESGIEGVFSETVKIGDHYTEGVFSTPTVEELFEFKPVKPMYFRIALLQTGLLETIEKNLTGANKIAFEYALEFERFDPMIVGVAQAFNISENSLDDLFKLAMTLQEGN